MFLRTATTEIPTSTSRTIVRPAALSAGRTAQAKAAQAPKSGASIDSARDHGNGRFPRIARSFTTARQSTECRATTEPRTDEPVQRPSRGAGSLRHERCFRTGDSGACGVSDSTRRNLLRRHRTKASRHRAHKTSRRLAKASRLSRVRVAACSEPRPRGRRDEASNKRGAGAAWPCLR